MAPGTMIRACLEALAVRRSTLLQTDYYRSQFFKELGPDRYLLRLSPSLHYVLFGARQNRNPNPLFDTEYYRAIVAAELRDGGNPLVHFLQRGAREGRNPGPFFDTTYYLEANPAVGRQGLNPLAHYFDRGQAAGSFPSPVAAAVRQLSRPLEAEGDGRAWLLRGLGPRPAPGPAPAPAAHPDRVIRFHWDRGGWNNIRMQAEVMVCLASLYGRALVLPEPSAWYQLPPEATHLFDFFDEAAFRAAVPLASAASGPGGEWRVPARLGVTNTVRLRRQAFERERGRSSWYFPATTRMFGPLGAVLGRAACYDLVHRAFRVRPELLERAVARLRDNGLEPGRYVAAHVRRGDFHHTDIRYLSVAGVIESLRRHGADEARSVLIVSDEHDESLIAACREEGWNTVCWAADNAANDKFAGVLDMLCCCPAWRFVGTPLSTFSAGIMQWRGYVSSVDGAHVDAVPRFTVDVAQPPWWALVDQHAWLTIGSSTPAS